MEQTKATTSGIATGGNTAAGIAVGGLSGGVGSVLVGGSFWDGAGQGIISSALNHGLHSLASGPCPSCPPGVSLSDLPPSWQMAVEAGGELIWMDDCSVVGLRMSPGSEIISSVGSGGALSEVGNYAGLALPSIKGIGPSVKSIFNFSKGKNGSQFWIGKLRIAKETHSLNPLKGGTDSVRVSHINIGKFHIILERSQWGIMTKHKFWPFR